MFSDPKIPGHLEMVHSSEYASFKFHDIFYTVAHTTLPASKILYYNQSCFLREALIEKFEKSWV